MKKKVVVILSGGIDSSTLCYKYVKEHFDVHSLTMIYGQKHLREIKSAKKVAQTLGIHNKLIDLSLLQDVLSSSALINPDIEIPKIYSDSKHFDSLKSTIVPNRNMIFLSIATGYSQSIGADMVCFGAHHSDRGVYPDCRKEFVEAFEYAAKLAVDNSVLKIEAPFIEMDKSEIIKIGNELGVPFEQTWTCYEGNDLHCGSCSACRERIRAFEEAGIKDPTQYEL